MGILPRLLLCCLLLAGLAGASHAAEEIRSFHARIDVGANGTLRVSEQISVNAEGNRISRGIFRDIPLRYEDVSGRMREVGLDVLAVTRDGRDEPYTVERGSGILRIRIGDANVLLRPGEHAYAITYETTRQIRFFDDHDELYWNVTGNGWDFPIRAASADIRLPNGAAATDVTYYTGPYGSTEQAARAQRLDGGSRIIVEASRALGPREGLTAVVAFAKGVVAPPTAAEEQAQWLRDNLGWIIGGFGFAVVLAYYFWAWSRVGRDPPAGVVVPRWTPPEGDSPALLNYIEQRGFRGQGWDAFSAAILSLAVKGHVELEDLGANLTIRRKGSNAVSLPAGETAILSQLPQDGDTLTVDKNNGERVQTMGTSFRSAIEKEHRNQFYRHNPGYLIVGVLLSVLVIGAILLLGDLDPETMAAGIGIIAPAVIISFVAVNIGRQLRAARSLGARIAAVITAALVGFIALSVLSVFAMVFFFEGGLDNAMLIIAGGLMIANIVFFYLMGAPTPIGRKMMDEIAGLKQYLTLAEKDRMNMQGAPEMSPRHFETLLPYAVALGVEKPWARAFDAWLAAATAAGVAAAYTGPGWYHGNSFSSDKIGSSLGGIAGSLSDSFTASLPAPKSSSSGFSSGGGGFSGGGGGGGGGGGW